MNTNWRTTVLDSITNNYNPITLVSDPDSLLGDPEIQQALEKKGFTSYKYTDHIQFRYQFETQYRKQVSTNRIKLLIITEIPEPNLRLQIPYDLYKKSQITNLSLKKIFPKLDDEVLKELSTSQLNRLFNVYQNYTSENIGYRLTCNYILETIFNININTILTQTDYIIALGNKKVPPALLQHLNAELETKQIQPLILFTNEQELIDYLTIIWTDLINNNRKNPKYNEYTKIRTIIIEYLLNGQIKQQPVVNPLSYPNWMRLGLLENTTNLNHLQIQSLIEQLESTLESNEISHHEWRNIAEIWGQITQIRCELIKLTEPLKKRLNQNRQSIESAFSKWILENHQALYLIRERTPVTLSQISEHLQRNYPREKIALLIIDGMSIDQWIKIKHLLTDSKPNLIFQESFTYAAIPTITSISRQTIASGSSPMFFDNEAQVYSKEESLWASNWRKRNRSTGYIKGQNLLKKEELETICNLFDKDALLIISTFLDDLLHSAVDGKPQIHDQLEYWVQNGIISDLLETLLDEQYHVFVTSDHGNVETNGMGTLNQGILTEKKSSRVRIYKEKAFAEQGKTSYPDSIIYPNKPDQAHYFLYAPIAKSFTRQGPEYVTHGGLSIEEVIVPFVRITKDAA